MKTLLSLLATVFIGIVFFVPILPEDDPPKKVVEQKKIIADKERNINNVIAVLEQNMERDSLNIIIYK
nr:hypothetical protein [uncultured Flavobacterium sp.]